MATSLLTLSAVSIDDWDSTDWATKVTQFNSTPVANVSGVNGVTAAATPPSARYWRIYILNNWNAGAKSTDMYYTEVMELEMMDVTDTDLCTTAGSITADSEVSDKYDHLSIDDNGATFWQPTYTEFPHWLRYDFGAGNEKTIVKVTIDPPATWSGYNWVADFYVQYSSDGTNFTTVYTGTHGDNANKETFTW